MSDRSEDQITVETDGQVYLGWERTTCGRELERCASHLQMDVTERWLGQDTDWKLLPFGPIVVRIGDDPVMTGYLDEYEPDASATEHKVRVVGRSKTEDLIDCTPDIKSGQFTGYSVAAITRAICQVFGIDVVVETANADAVLPQEDTRRVETAWRFIDRLCKLATVLATDDPLGRLVLTNAGQARSSGALVEGVNILRQRGRFSGAKRFSHYIVKGQTGVGLGVGVPADNWGGAGGIGAPGGGAPAAKSAKVQTSLEVVAIDTDVPRYRPTVKLAESQIGLAQMQERANWQRAYAYGRSVEAQITVQGYRQPDGRLWQLNEIVPVQSGFLGVDQDLLIVGVNYRIDPEVGRVTELKVGPVEGYVPDPAQVKARHKKGKHGKGKAGPNWNGAGGA
jgi:prophage tail gpP-like protein